jgi:hypothetical protein
LNDKEDSDPQVGFVKAEEGETSEQGSKRKRSGEIQNEIVPVEYYNQQRFKNVPSKYEP